MLPFPLTLLSVSNSNHLRAFLAPCELDVRRKSSRSRLRTPARQARLAFLPEALAMTGAPDSATSIRRYREALANDTRHPRSEELTSELQSHSQIVSRRPLE